LLGIFVVIPVLVFVVEDRDKDKHKDMPARTLQPRRPVATTKEDRPPVKVPGESEPSLLTVSGRAQIILFFVALEID